MKQIKTQHTPLHRPQWALTAIAATLVAAGILGACTPEEEHVKRNNPIVLNAGPINGDNTALPLYFAFSEELSAGGYGVYGNQRTGTRTAGKEVQPITNITGAVIQDTYNVSGLRTKVTGWYPGGGTDTDVTTSGKGYYYSPGQTVTWTIDGTQDIIIAAAQEGSVANPIPPLVFKHCLTQILLHPYAETSTAISAWGKITSIEVVNQPNTVKYSLKDDATGAVTFTGSANKTIALPSGGASLPQYSIANKDRVPQVGAPIMIAPKASGTALTLRIYTANNEMKTITLNQELKAGTPYRLYLRFTERDIFINTSITQWTPVDNKNTVGKVNVGDYRDGGIVYYIDPNTPGSYYVMSLDEPTVGTNNRLQWAARNDYTLGAQHRWSTTDGSANVAAIKATFDSGMAGVGITEEKFEDAFPAAAYCYNYQGRNGNDAKGTWYLPSKDEMQYLYCAFNGVPHVSWDAGPGPGADTKAQTKWNNIITAAGGTPLRADDLYWISAEAPAMPDGNLSNFAWGIFFRNGTTSPMNLPKSGINSVRCVRRITPPPAVGDFYFLDGSYSQVINPGDNIEGIIYYVDPSNPKKFKVVSMKDMTTAEAKWAANSNYIIGIPSQSLTDGKGNCDAVKTAFDNKHVMGGNTQITETGFVYAFPAVAECYHYTGVQGGTEEGTWHLPAKNELQYLYCAYNGITPRTWNTDSETTPNTEVQWRWRMNLLHNNGDAFADKYWSSSECNDGHGSNTDQSWTISLDAGGTNRAEKISAAAMVRCVRDIQL